MENNLLNRVWHWFIRWLRDGILWKVFEIAVGVIFATLSNANQIDPLGLAAKMNQWVALIIYFVIGVIGASLLVGAITTAPKLRPALKRLRRGLGIVPHDFGIDASNRHIVGFRIVEPQEKFHATLEALWTCETDRDDIVTLWHHINATSRNLENPSSGLFKVAIRFSSDPRFMLTMADGYYARFILSRYYRARVFIRNQSNQIKKCIDVIIHSTSGDSSRTKDIFEVARIDDNVDCKGSIDPPMGMEDTGSRTWATEKIFQPNLW